MLEVRPRTQKSMRFKYFLTYISAYIMIKAVLLGDWLAMYIPRERDGLQILPWQDFLAKLWGGEILRLT
jgi:hypothetical protein